MALPSNVSTGTVTGQFVLAVADGSDSDYDPDTYPVGGTVTFTPSVPYLPNPSGAVTILADKITGILDGDGYLCTPDPDNDKVAGRRGVQLIATDDPDLSVTGWTWNVTYQFAPRNKVSVPSIPAHSILVPSGATVDLTSAVKVPSSTGIGLDQVTVIRSEALAAAADADTSANLAGARASDAAGYATASAGSAAAASGSASSASASASSATTSSNSATTSASAAAGSATAAAGSATSAASSATAALSSQNAAATSATNASGSATAAANSATSAANSATAAKGALGTNVKDYGAVGDGITDDTAAIQRAVDAIGNGTAPSTRLYFGTGRYWPKGAVVLNRNVTEITGSGATIVKIAGSTSSVVFAGLSDGGTGYGAGISNFSMHGIAFEGTFGTNKQALCAMSLHHSQNVQVYGCTFKQASGTGHRFDLQGCRDITIRDNEFWGFDTSYGELYAEDIQADFSSRIGASYAETDVTRYDSLPTRDVVVENNKWLPITISGTTYPAGNPFGSHATMVGRYVENLTFENNYVENPVNDTTSTTPGTLHFVAPRNLIIKDNTFVGNANTCPVIKVWKASTAFPDATVQQADATTVAVSPPQVFTDVTISGNKVTGYTGGADMIRLDGATDAHGTNAAVENNTLTNNSPDNGATNSGPITVNINYTDGVTYRGNKVRGSRRVCFITWCTSVTVAQNVGVNIGANDINIDNCTQVTVTGNTLTGSKYFAIYVNLGSDVAVSGNSLEGHINDATAPLIRATTPVRVAVTGNVLKGLAGTSNKGIEFTGTFTSSLIANNIATGFTSPILPAATATGATIGTNVTT